MEPLPRAPQATLPWRKWLLWILLLTAALVTGRMAWRLYREMNHAEPGQPGPTRFALIPDRS